MYPKDAWNKIAAITLIALVLIMLALFFNEGDTTSKVFSNTTIAQFKRDCALDSRGIGHNVQNSSGCIAITFDKRYVKVTLLAESSVIVLSQNADTFSETLEDFLTSGKYTEIIFPGTSLWEESALAMMRGEPVKE